MMDVVTADGGRFSLGAVEAGATVGMIDFSRRVTDDFGVTTVVERGFSRRLSVRLAVPSEDADALQRRLADLRSTAARWIVDDGSAWLSPSGFYKDFDIDLAVPPLSFCTLTVEGLAESEAGSDTGGDPAPMGASTLCLLQPFTVTDATLIGSSVAENDAPAWAAGTGYIVGAKVLRQHRVYEAVIANAGKDPVAGGSEWLDTGPTNRWAMFDQALGTVTAAQGEIAVLIDIAAIQAVALLDVTGATVRVVADGYDRTQAVTGGAVTFLDLGGRGRVSITIAGAGAVSVGTVLVGKLVALGLTEASPTAGITDFSRKDVDDFGEVTIVKRGWAKRMTAKALIRTDALDLVANRIAAVRATPSLWIGQDGRDSLTIYGFFKDFEIAVDGPLSKLSLSVEGLSAAAKVAPLVEWEAVGNSGGKKPSDNADKTSENIAKDTASVGGTPSVTVNDQLKRIDPIAIDTAALKKATADLKVDTTELDEAVDRLRQRDDAAETALSALRGVVLDGAATQRQRDRAEGRLSEAAVQLLLMQENADRRMRDAGFITDPATGKVYAYAIDAMGERQTKVEATLDAQAGQIALRATSAEVDAKILQAVLDPAQVAKLEPLIARIATVETVYDALRAEVRTKAELVELTRAVSRITDTEQRISAAEGSIASKVEQTSFAQAITRIGAAEQLLQSYGDVSRYGIELRQSRVASAQSDAALLGSVLGEHQADELRLTTQALLRQELYTKIVDDVDGVKRVEARARTELAIQLQALDARSVQDRLLLIEADRVLAQGIDALGVQDSRQAAQIATLQDASIEAGRGLAGVAQTIRQQVRSQAQGDAALLGDVLAGDQAERRFITSLAEIHTQLTTTLVVGFEASAAARQALRARIDTADARFDQEARTTASRFNAVTELVTALTARFDDPATGLAATRGDISRLERVTAEAAQVNAQAIESLRAVVNDPATGLPKTRAELAALNETVATQNSAAVRRLASLEAALFDPATGLAAAFAGIAAAERAQVDGDAAVAEQVRQVRATMNDPATGLPQTRAELGELTTTVATQNDATVRQLGVLEATVNAPDTGLAKTRAELAAEKIARADGNRAEAEARATLSAQVNDPATGLPWARSAIGDLARVTNDRDNANAALIQQVRTMLDGIGNVGIQQAFEAVINRLGVIEGRYSVAIDVNGNWSGFQLIGGPVGPASFNLINTDLRLGTGKVVFDDGKMMMVQGVGFGVARDLLEWFGPSMAIDKCSRANAKSFRATDGAEYMGGSLSISTMTHPGGSASLAADAVAEVASFGSNGKPVRYVASWSYTSEWTEIYAADNNGLKSFDTTSASYNATSDDGGYTYFGSKTEERSGSTITLTRSFGSSSAQLGQRTFTTEQRTFRGLRPVPAAGEAGNATFTATIGGGFTVQDPEQSTATRTLKLVLSRGFTLSEGVTQRLAILAIEE